METNYNLGFVACAVIDLFDQKTNMCLAAVSARIHN